MAKQKIKSGVIMLVALALLVVPLTLSCAPEPSTELKTLKVAFAGPYTGPWAALVHVFDAGAKDYIRYANEAELIPGVNFELLTGDTGYNPAQSLSLYQRFKGEGIIFLSTPTTTDAEPLTKFLAEDEITGISVSVSTPMVSPPGWWFTPAALYEDAFAGYCKWIAEENWDWEGEGRAPRIATIGFDNPLGRAPTLAEDYVEENYNVDYALDIIVPIGVADATVEMTRIKQAEVDYVFMSAGIPEIMVMLKDAAKLGLRDTATFAISHGQAGMYSAWKKMPELIAGVHLLGCYSYINEDLPDTNLARELQEKYHLDAFYEDTGYFMSYLPMMIGIDAVKKAIEEVGLENLTSADVKETLESGEVIDTGDIVPPLSWDKESRIIHSIKFYIMTPEGEVVRIKDWIELPSIAGIK